LNDILHVACNYHYLGWVLTWKYLKQGFWGENFSFWLKNRGQVYVPKKERRIKRIIIRNGAKTVSLPNFVWET
jgi:hypothetical protein